MDQEIIKANASYIGGGVLGAVVAYSVYGAISRRRNMNVVRDKIEKKQKEEQQIIDDTRKKVEDNLKTQPQLRNEIGNCSATELVRRMQEEELDPSYVLDVYMLKALEADRKFNCVTNVIPEAFTDVDALQDGDKRSKMLYGLPVSLKECCQVKNQDCTVGMSKFIGDKSLEDCVVIQTLKHCGAIPFVRTNLPQTMISFESSNPIYGETSNPLNKDFTPGGSSSGEGSLVGAGGSPLGFGTDFGGSIRCPSHMCGICGLKPTGHRLSLKGVAGCIPGQSVNSESIGPMAQDVDTLVLAMRALLCDYMFERDQLVPPIPFNDQIYESDRKLRIGYCYSDGYTKPIPACVRAVKMAKEALEGAGHTLVPFQIPDIEKAMLFATETLTADEGKVASSKLHDDVIDKVMQPIYGVWTTSYWKRKLAAMIGSKYPRQAFEKNVFAKRWSSLDYYKLNSDVIEYKYKFFKQWREENKIDALICPSYPIVASPKGNVMHAMSLWNYTYLYDVLNCPAGVVTITKVTADDIRKLGDYVGHYNDPWDEHVKNATRGSLNMPVSVQCVALPWQDEMCLRVMKEVQTLAKE